MNDKKHTSGPWGFSGPWGWLTKEGGFSIVAGKQNEQVVICSRNSCSPDAGEMIANARLIAAAPEMLDELMNYCAECNGGDDERCPYYNKDGDMCRMAQDGTCGTWMTICKAAGHDPATPWEVE